MHARAIAWLFLLGCLVSWPASATDFPVTVGGTAGNVFAPMDLTVHVGDTVTFTNAGGFHNAASDPDSVTTFRCADGCAGEGGSTGDPSGVLWTFTITLDTAGSVPYHCEVHGAPGAGMHGTITVEDVAPPPPVAEVTPAAFDFTLEPDQTTADGLAISNTGDPASELEFTIGEAGDDCANAIDVPWLAVSPTNTGTVAGGDFAMRTVDIDSTGLAPDIYSARLCITTNDPDNALIPVPVSLTVTVADRIFASGFDGP